MDYKHIAQRDADDAHLEQEGLVAQVVGRFVVGTAFAYSLDGTDASMVGVYG